MRKITFTLIGILALFSLRLSAANYYWVGDGGDWTDYSTHWATSSGGSTFYTSAPGASDDVYFDANSFSASGQTVNFTGGTEYVHNFDCTGSAGFIADGSGVLHISGDYILVAGTAWNHPDVILDASSGTKTVDLQGDSISYVSFFGTGTWNLASNMHCFIIGLYEGTVNTQGHTVVADYAFSVSSAYTNALNLDTSHLYAAQIDFPSTMTLSSADATIHTSYMVSGIDLTLKKLVESYSPYAIQTYINLSGTASIQTADVNSDGSLIIALGTVGNINFNASGDFGSGAYIQKLVMHSNLRYSASNVDTLMVADYNTYLRVNPYGSNVISHLLTATPTCNSFFTICSDYPARAAQVNLENPSYVDNCAIFDIEFTSAGNMYALNSLDLGNVTNCSFTPYSVPEDTMYWIGDKGNWSDPSHWAASSGGAAGSCIPSPNTTVIVDSNSFSTADTMFVDLPVTYCKNFTVSNVPAGTRLYLSNNGYSSPPQFLIRGSIDVSSDFSLDYYGRIYMVDSGFKNISAPGQQFTELILSNTNATWNMERALHATSLTHMKGKLVTHDSTIVASYFEIYDTTWAGSSLFNTYSFGSYDANGYIDADSLTLRATYAIVNNVDLHRLVGNGTLQLIASGSHIHTIDAPYDLQIGNSYSSLSEFDRINVSGDLYYNSKNTNHRIDAAGNIQMNRSNQIDSLFLNGPGKSLSIASDSTLTINDTISFASSSGNEISIFSSSSGTQANLAINTASDMCADYLILQDINSSGTAAFYAGSNSTDNGNNTNITFSDCPGPRLMAPAAPSVSLYPNPAGNTTTLNLGKFDGGELRIRIYDMQGHLVYSENKGDLDAGNYSFTIPVEGFAAGLYNCQVDAGNRHESIRLVKPE